MLKTAMRLSGTVDTRNHPLIGLQSAAGHDQTSYIPVAYVEEIRFPTTAPPPLDPPGASALAARHRQDTDARGDHLSDLAIVAGGVLRMQYDERLARPSVSQENGPALE
jgi:hypothetical protein